MSAGRMRKKDERLVDRESGLIQIESIMTNMRNFTGSNITTSWC
jgi:hypothetical protein